ncbi:MAG: hypothetical protein CMG69_05975 [Candidatus Marinimicrobia bacterium]|nr:hypothetical protein [Candidatus Neomarinimicrobiota bacterium]
MVNENINIVITWIFRILWFLCFGLLLIVKEFQFKWKLVYIGYIILLSLITILRIREAQKEWYKE